MSQSIKVEIAGKEPLELPVLNCDLVSWLVVAYRLTLFRL